MSAQREHALVVGASSGIGCAIATRLRGRGTRVSALSRRPAPAQAADASFACDVTVPGKLEQAMAAAVAAHGPADLLVYAAGLPVMGRTLSVPPDQARLAFELNFWGLDRAVRQVLPAMAARGRGTVLAVLSLSALRSIPFEAYYGASKAAAARYLGCLAQEAERDGVRVKYLCPGFIDTGFLERGGWFGTSVPALTGSGLTEEEVAQAALGLLDDERRFAVVGWKEGLLALGDRLLPGLVEKWVRFRRRG
ncbi:MAG TPA: SDR family oxidoreductase [Polyangia bacterium]|nr:SDR family oxidoreductase [Polyangia bacterium]